jgi:hypothetical protein
MKMAKSSSLTGNHNVKTEHETLRDELKSHYATKDFVWGRTVAMGIILAALYAFITIPLIDARTASINDTLREIKSLLASKAPQ